MNIFDFDDFHRFLGAKVKSLPKQGRGQYRRIAEFLGVHTTLISQVFSGTKLLSLENAMGICEYFGMNESETEYFLCLVQIDRAGQAKLKRMYEKQAAKLREKGVKLENRLPRDKILDESDKAIFYSNWYYSAIRVVTSLPECQTAENIGTELRLPIGLVNQVLEFLVSRGLCLLEKDGRISVGPKRTFLEAESPLIGRHHANWRIRAIEHYPYKKPLDFVYTSPLSISEGGFQKVRMELVHLVESVSRHISDEEPEKFVCFNIDWLEIPTRGQKFK